MTKIKIYQSCIQCTKAFFTQITFGSFVNATTKVSEYFLFFLQLVLTLAIVQAQCQQLDDHTIVERSAVAEPHRPIEHRPTGFGHRQTGYGSHGHANREVHHFGKRAAEAEPHRNGGHFGGQGGYGSGGFGHGGFGHRFGGNRGGHHFGKRSADGRQELIESEDTFNEEQHQEIFGEQDETVEQSSHVIAARSAEAQPHRHGGNFGGQGGFGNGGYGHGGFGNGGFGGH